MEIPVIFQSKFNLSLGSALLGPLSFGRQHMRAVALASASLLTVGAGGAWAVSQASKAQSPDNATVLLIESVAHLPLEHSAEDGDFTLYRTELVRKSDSNAKLLKRLGVDDAEALQFINNDAKARVLANQIGRSVEVQTDPQGRLQRLLVRYPAGEGKRFTRLSVQRNAQDQLESMEQTGYMQAVPMLGYATVNGTVYGAMDAAGIPDEVGTQLIEIFSTQIDFQRNLKRGDSFKILYETLQADGEDMGTGRVLGAEFVNGNRTYTAVWYEPEGRAGAYYSLGGEGLQKSYLAAPLKFTRVSSGFGMRDHPIWKNQRQHKGIDYAAPTGTPIMTVADGTVKFAGWQNGYGNAVEVVHGNGRSTFYAHMSRIATKQGDKVSQGDHIGDVGSTGWSTGPHLHFEYRVNGVYQDPTQMAEDVGSNQPLAKKERAAFAAIADDMRKQFADAKAVQLASLQ